VHPLQRPLPSQTPPGHVVPLVALLAKPHTGTPVSHAIAPFVHGLPVLQANPAVHAMHRPLPSHTPPLHAVPAPRCPVALQIAAPVAQSIAPLSHSLIGVHDAACTHATHMPRPLHTPPGHDTPAAAFESTTHCAAPLPHSCRPVVHTSPVLHGIPCMHGKH
jgi:hypothetical protein